MAAGTLTRLDLERPSVTLTRLQSGVGALAVSLVGVEAEHAALGCVYEMDAKSHARTLVVDAGTDPVPRPGQPLWGSFKKHQRIFVDLRQVALFRRALFYVTIRPGRDVASSCALAFAVQGVELLECPMDLPVWEGVVVLATIYNVFGELVIRWEFEAFDAPARGAIESHGFSLPYSEG